mmetsp:Transcript_23608/g.69506  ORF Transcript_23608/g.69506 Transcript_23608/m.69506 type:complete len:319 (-) Transcript_23608:147-1103(-)
MQRPREHPTRAQQVSPARHGRAPPNHNAGRAGEQSVCMRPRVGGPGLEASKGSPSQLSPPTTPPREHTAARAAARAAACAAPPPPGQRRVRLWRPHLSSFWRRVGSLGRGRGGAGRGRVGGGVGGVLVAGRRGGEGGEEPVSPALQLVKALGDCKLANHERGVDLRVERVDLVATLGQPFMDNQLDAAPFRQPPHALHERLSARVSSHRLAENNHLRAAAGRAALPPLPRTRARRGGAVGGGVGGVSDGGAAGGGGGGGGEGGGGEGGVGAGGDRALGARRGAACVGAAAAPLIPDTVDRGELAQVAERLDGAQGRRL